MFKIRNELLVQGCQDKVNISFPQAQPARLWDVYSYYLEKKKKEEFKCHVYAPMKYIFPIAEAFHQLYFSTMWTISIWS